MPEQSCADLRSAPPCRVMSRPPHRHPRGLPPQFWPPDGRLARLHDIAVGRRIVGGELPLAAQLHAIAEVIGCATADERAEMLAMELAEEGGA